MSLYANGLRTGEISAHFQSIYGASVSKERVSRITDKVLEEMATWQARPLQGGRIPLVVANHRVPPSSHHLGWGEVIEA